MPKFIYLVQYKLIKIVDISTFVEILNNKGELVFQELQKTPIKGRLRTVSKVDIYQNETLHRYGGFHFVMVKVPCTIYSYFPTDHKYDNDLPIYLHIHNHVWQRQYSYLLK